MRAIAARLKNLFQKAAAMAKGFPDYFGELVLPVSVPNGGTGGTSFSSGKLLQGNGTSSISASAVDAGKTPQLAAQTDETGLVGGGTDNFYNAPAAGFYLFVLNGYLTTVNTTPQTVTYSARWTQNSVEQTVQLASLSNSAAGGLGCGAAIGIYPDANTEVSLVTNLVTGSTGDTYDYHVRLLKIV